MATDTNVIVLTGRLTRDAQVKFVGSNSVVLATFGIAVNKSRKKDDEWIDEASFFECSAWGSVAETPGLTKGAQVRICGSLKLEQWTDKDGNKKSLVRIVADMIHVQGQSQRKAPPKPEPAPPLDGDDAAPAGDDIPF